MDLTTQVFYFSYSNLNYVISCIIFCYITLNFMKFSLLTVSEKEFHDEFDKLLDKLEVKSPFLLVVQVRM